MTTGEFTVTILGILSGWLTATFGWFKWWYELVEKRRERAEKEKAEVAQLIAETSKASAEAAKVKAEAELNEARNRADAAFFLASSARFSSLACGHNKQWLLANGNVLSVFREDVTDGIKDDDLVVLPLANEGAEAKAVSFKKDGVPIHSVRYINGDRSLWGILEYPFVSEMRGKTEIIEVTFESANGFHRTHRYATQHGKRQFIRIEPKLPS